MIRLKDKDRALLIGLCCTCGGALYVLIRFLVTGEMLVRRGWATFAERPLSVVIGLCAVIVTLLGSGLAAYLIWTGRAISERRFRALDRRALLDNGRRQDRHGHDVEP